MLTRRLLHPRFLLLIAGTLLFLISCGFQLRGTETLIFKKIYIEGHNNLPLYIEIQRALRQTGTQIETDRNKADAMLVLHNAQRDRQVISLNPQGQIRELRLTLQAQFALLTPSGQEVMAPAELSLSRDLTYSETAVLAKQVEESQLYTNMEQDAAQQIVRRLAAIKTLPASPTPTTTP